MAAGRARHRYRRGRGGRAEYLLVIVTGEPLRAGWLPRTDAGTGPVALPAVRAVNLTGSSRTATGIATLRTCDADVTYLATLSADAVPALERPPPALPALGPRSTAGRPDRTPDDWRSRNRGRGQAGRAVAD